MKSSENSSFDTGAVNEQYYKFFRENSYNFITSTEKKRFCIPLKFMFKQLNAFEGGLFVSNHQPLKMQIRVAENVLNTCLLVSVAGNQVLPTDLSLTNMNVCYKYAKLDQARLDLVLQNKFIYYPKKVHASSTAITSSNYLRFSVGAQETARRVIFAFHSKHVSTLDTNSDAFNTTQLLALTANPFTNENLMFPEVNVSFVNISLGGYQVQYNMQQLELLDLLTPVFDPENKRLYGQARSRLSCAYVLNLDRFAEDLIGSSASVTDANFEVNIQLAGEHKPLGVTDGTDTVTTAVLSNHLYLYGFLETESRLHLSGGRYFR